MIPPYQYAGNLKEIFPLLILDTLLNIVYYFSNNQLRRLAMRITGFPPVYFYSAVIYVFRERKKL